MSRVRIASLALGTAAMAAVLGGCAGMGSGRPARLTAQPATADKVDKLVRRAEASVAKNAADAAARAALGAAYLKAGRFASATAAFDDALELGDQSAATVLGLTLAEIALGHRDAALQLLNDWAEVLPVADRGLALALAGETARGVEVLGNALRDGQDTAQLRQNLAFAYALDGRWREARVMAAQDVAADQLDARISQWAMMGRPEAVQQRVAHLLGAPVRQDLGYPQRFALAPAAPAAVAAAPLDAPQSAAEPALELAAAPAAPDTPAPATAAPLEPAAVAASFAPAVVQTAASPVPVAAAAAVQRRVVGSYGKPAARPGFASEPTAAKSAARPLKPVAKAAPPAAGTGSHWVQLGAFTDPAVAKDAARRFLARNRGARLTTTSAVVNGTLFHRVAATGFAGYAPAAAMCRTVRSKGGDCLVVGARPQSAPQVKLARR